MFGMVIETGPKFYMVPFTTQKVTDSDFYIKVFTIPIPMHDLKIKVTDFEFFVLNLYSVKLLQSL